MPRAHPLNVLLQVAIFLRVITDHRQQQGKRGDIGKADHRIRNSQEAEAPSLRCIQQCKRMS